MFDPGSSKKKCCSKKKKILAITPLFDDLERKKLYYPSPQNWQKKLVNVLISKLFFQKYLLPFSDTVKFLEIRFLSILLL